MKLYRITTKKSIFSGPFYGKKSGVLYFVTKHFLYNALDSVFGLGNDFKYVYIWEFVLPGRNFNNPSGRILLPMEIVKLGKITRVTKIKFEEFTKREFKHYINRWRAETNRILKKEPKNWLIMAAVDPRTVNIPSNEELEEAFMPLILSE